MKNAIALLITIFFVSVITLSIGLGLKYIKDAKHTISYEQFILKATSISNDILHSIETSKKVQEINDAESLNLFLSQTALIPLTYKNISITIKIQTARGKINPNIFKDKKRANMLRQYLIKKMILPQYVDILQDSINGIKEDGAYLTDIFNNNPTLFRDYIASYQHLEKLNTIYKNTYHDNNIKNLHIKELFYPTKEQDTPIDLNYATAEVFELILGCNSLRAEELSGGYYETLQDLNLNANEKQNLEKFSYSFYEPYIDIHINISQNNNNFDMSKTMHLQ